MTRPWVVFGPRTMHRAQCDKAETPCDDQTYFMNIKEDGFESGTRTMEMVSRERLLTFSVDLD